MAVSISRFEIKEGKKTRLFGLPELLEGWRAEKKYGISIPVPFPEGLSLPSDPSERAHFLVDGSGEVDVEKEIGGIGSALFEIASRADVLFRFSPSASREVCFIVGSGANVIFEETGGDTNSCIFASFFLEFSSHLHAKGKIFSEGFYKKEWRAELLGKKAQAHFVSAFLSRGEGVIDVFQKILHKADVTESSIETRGILYDKSQIICRGTTDLPRGFRNLSGHEDLKFITLSPKATVSAIPVLEVATPQVSCSHSLSISAMSSEEVFYAKTRGFSEEEAREIITEGFLKV